MTSHERRNEIVDERPRRARSVPSTTASSETRAGVTVHRWRAFSLLAAAYFMTIVDFTIVNVALPTIGRRLHFSESNLQWVVTAYALTFGGFLLLGGRAADFLGRRRLFMLGMALFTAASCGCALARSDTLLIVMRGLQGLGAAAVIPASLSIVTNMFDEGAERNKALGVWGGLGAAAGTTGLLAGGVLTRYAGWPAIFYFNVPIGLVALLLARRVVPESRLDDVPRRYDPFGAVTSTAALVLLVYAISQAPQVGWTAPRSLGMLAAAGALLVAFVIVETWTKAPLLPLRLFGIPTVAASNIVGFLLGASFLTFVFLGTLYMQQVLGFSALQTGAAWCAASAMSVVLAAVSQKLVTRTSPQVIMTIGMTLIGAGILWATRAPADGHFWRNLAGPFLVCGVGTSLSFIPISIGALTGISEADTGVASGLLNTSQQIGAAIGVAVTSTIAATHTHALLRDHSRPVALTGGFHWAFIVCGLTALVAFPVAMGSLRLKPSASPVAATTPETNRERSTV